MRKSILALLIMVAAAAPASAIDKGFYVGGGIGVASFDVRDFNEDYADLRFTDDGFGFKVFGGFKFLKFLGVEAGYIDYGTITKHETSITAQHEELKVGISSWDASAVGFLAVGKKADLFARVGVASWDADVRVTVDGVSEDQSQNGTDLTFGLGIDFLFKKVGMRVLGDWLKAGDTSSAFMFSVNLTYHF